MRHLIALLLMWVVPGLCLAQADVREAATRPGVTVRFIYAKAENPVASAVLFQGGPGNIGILPNGTTRNEGFLATGARRFTDNGISVAIPDVPSDRSTLNDFRHTAEHAQDAAALIAFLRQQAPVPVWAVGTSNGALSAASASVHLKDAGPAGIVLTSSVTRAPRSMAHSVLTAPLHEVTVPVLLVHHRNDGCRISQYDAAAALIAEFKAARKVELITAEGGLSGDGDCSGGHHIYLGIEAAVTRDIVDWIKRVQGEAAK